MFVVLNPLMQLASFYTRIAFLILFIVAGTCAADGQDFKANLLIGLNASQVDGDNLSGYNKAGLRAGAEISYPLNDNQALGSGLIYSQRGSSSSSDSPGFLRIRINYIEIPLHYIYATSKWEARAGLVAGTLLNARTDNGTGFTNSRNLYRNLDLSYELSAGYRVNGRIVLTISHLQSIPGFARNTSDLPGFFLQNTLRHRFFSLGVRYAL